MPWSPSRHWLPNELARFDRRCTYCDVRVRRWGAPGGWQGIDGLFICWRGTEPPNRGDLDRRHVVEQSPNTPVA